MTKKKTPSQLMELFLSVAKELGLSSDRDVATLADVGPENVANWRSGAVQEFKTQKFQAARANLAAHLQSLRAQAGLIGGEANGLHALEIEDGSSPSDLERQLRQQVVYDYLGHRFLYFEPQGALAWENLIRAGYEQDCWLDGVRTSATKWLDTKKDNQSRAVGPIARALRLDRRDKPRGLDIISLGPGEGGKEAVLLRQLLDMEKGGRRRFAWISYAPVDVSIPLLLTAASNGRRALLGDDSGNSHAYRSVLAFCADFEEGPLHFQNRLRTAQPSGADGLRLILILGAVLGNLRDEEIFVRQKLHKLARPGDLVWLEVGLRTERLESDPLFALTQDKQTETAGEANRRLLLEGPYRRLAAALGRPTPNLGLRVWVREDDDSTRIPGSINFCHDMLIKDESRACTMLYSRRYELEALSTWFESLDFEVQGIQRTQDSKGRPRVAHFLLRRR